MRQELYAVVAFDGITPFHLSVPCIVFRPDAQHPQQPEPETRVCAATPGPLRTGAGFSLQCDYGLEGLDDAGTVIVPGWPNPDTPPPAELLQALRRAHQRGARIVGFCLGAFVLAAAGLLEGRRATTHWRHAAELARRHPQVQVDPLVLYIDDGDIVTSAGVAAALDCCLHLLRQRYGAEAANHAARRLVVSPNRQGGQAQYIEQPVYNAVGKDRLSQVMEWMAQHPETPHTLDELAARAAMSRRTFTRRFRQKTGLTVGQWLLEQRLALAQRLLESSAHPIERVAEQAGFASPALFRRSFSQAFGVKPSDWRRNFRTN